MDLGTLRGLLTVLIMLAFMGVCWWAFRPSNKERFEQDALLPFSDEPTEPTPSGEEQE